MTNTLPTYVQCKQIIEWIKFGNEHICPIQGHELVSLLNRDHEPQPSVYILRHIYKDSLYFLKDGLFARKLSILFQQLSVEQIKKITHLSDSLFELSIRHNFHTCAHELKKGLSLDKKNSLKLIMANFKKEHVPREAFQKLISYLPVTVYQNSVVVDTKTSLETWPILHLLANLANTHLRVEKLVDICHYVGSAHAISLLQLYNIHTDEYGINLIDPKVRTHFRDLILPEYTFSSESLRLSNSS